MENNSIDLFAPLASLQWVDRDKLHANDYNPNKVSEENLKLLVQSILTNGWPCTAFVSFVSLAVSSLSAVVVEFWSTWIRWLRI